MTEPITRPAAEIVNVTDHAQPAATVYIGREGDTDMADLVDPTTNVWVDDRGAFGNPFSMYDDGGTSREKVVAQFKHFLTAFFANEGAFSTPLEWRQEVGAAMETRLHGETLGCYCAPKHCHGEVLEHLVASGRWRQLLE